jgi:hypothetical protein
MSQQTKRMFSSMTMMPQPTMSWWLRKPKVVVVAGLLLLW